MNTGIAHEAIPHEGQSTADHIDSRTALKRNVSTSFITHVTEFAMKCLAQFPGFRAHDGRFTFAASLWAQSSAFADWSDVVAFLAQIGGSHGR